ncbi:MAG: dinitrogenase iron-molybdenum cofactor biosynthesis protein [Tissierellia bacterium]|nr:NifB/NifX family molybdenum-iron cluster-binding protein [Bacillota bacterium]NLK58928.1 dinitrogenase iron-molybdenum cofactor biosynthesis protein [Tissierellia bacterium]
MKIAIPVEENTLDAKVSSSFGRAAYFLIFDTQSDEARFIDNPAINSTGGAGILSAQTVVDAGADTLLTPRLGQNAADVIQDAGMQVFQSKEGTAKENIEACCAKTLKVLEEIHEGFHGHGNRE